jgi:hypothetical protein
MDHDLNVDSYTIDELFVVFKIDKTMDESTMMSNINKMFENIKKTNNKKYIEFITDAKYKIIRTLKKPNPDLNRNVFENINNNDNFSSIDGGNHCVIEEKITPVTYTYDYKFPNSKLNPIERRTMSKVICFDTIFRKNYKSTISNNVMWEMPYRLENVISMKLSSLQLPIQYYMFSAKEKNNVFNISLYNMSDFPDTSIDIIIPDGNYVTSDCINAINNYFTHVGHGLQYLYYDIDSVTAHSIFRAKNINDIGYETLHYPYDATGIYYSPNFYFELTFSGDSNLYNRDLHLNAGFILGYDQEKYVVKYENSYIANTGPSYILTNNAITYYAYMPSESSYGSATQHYIFLQVNDFNSNSYNTITSYIPNGYIENNILAKFEVVCGFNSFLFNNGSDCIFKQRDYFGPVTIDKLQVTLLNMYGKPLDLGQDNYSFSLEFTILYTN